MPDPTPANRILVIDDNPAIHADFEKILGRARDTAALDALEAQLLGSALSGAAAAAPMNIALTHAHQGEEGFRQVLDAVNRGEPFAAAFIDMRMPPGWDGLRTIQEIRKVDPSMTLVVCTAYADHSWDEIASRVAEFDKLLILKKPFDPIEVESIARSLAQRWTVTQEQQERTAQLETIVVAKTAELEGERVRNEARLIDIEQAVETRTRELRRLALHDKLTGLPNRLHFHEKLTAAIGAMRADPSEPLAVMFIDFDRFKAVNDTLGHRCGDALLVMLATRIEAVASQIRPVTSGFAPIAARIGGDEFCILLRGEYDDGRLQSIGAALLDALSQPYTIEGKEVASGASIGIARGRADHADAEDALRDADEAMYRAKHAGRGRFAMFDRTMRDEADRRSLLEFDLRHALHRGEFELHYQPVVSLQTGAVVGAESLLRWRHPRHGILIPGEFLPLAEQIGDTHAIGRWVVREACERLADWARSGLLPAPAHLSVNLSRRQLSDPALMRSIEASLASTGVDPSRLIVELPERELTADPDAAEHSLAELKGLGLRTFIDDFGAGVASLAALRRFDVAGLKLDRSFLDQRIFSRRNAAIIRSTLTLASDLSLELIAKGVEAIEQLALLQTLGCESAQGFLFAKPTGAPQVEAAVMAHQWIAPLTPSPVDEAMLAELRAA